MNEWIRTGAWIPVASFLSVVVSIVLYALAWGSRDAQQKAVTTWRDLAEGRDETIEELKEELDRTKEEVRELRAELHADRLSTRKAIDELIQGFTRALEQNTMALDQNTASNQ
jgi:ribosomal protein L29